MSDLGNITQGLGKFTPEVWQRLGKTILDNEGEQENPIRDALGTVDQYPSFFAKIKKAVLVRDLTEQGPSGGEVSGDPDDLCNPKRVFRYSFEQVAFKVNLATGPDVVPMNGAIRTIEESEEGEGDGNNLYAYNVGEFLQPLNRNTSFGGVMLKRNQYPDITVVPTIHNADTNTGGVTEINIDGNGPVVWMQLVDLVVPEVDEGDDPDPKDLRVAGMFYSPIVLDGICENQECDTEG